MNRKERRLKEKEKKREDNKKVEAMAWFKTLPPAKHLLIDSLIKIEMKKETDTLFQAIDRCFKAALAEKFEELDWEEIEKILDESADLLVNDAHKMKKLKEKLSQTELELEREKQAFQYKRSAENIDLEQYKTLQNLKLQDYYNDYQLTQGQQQLVDKLAKFLADRTQNVFLLRGYAGTGKTFLAVTLAVTALKRGQVKRIVLTRPAVEAGESLGFLPGDLKEKVDPYLRPVYDALYQILGKEQTTRLMEREIIEIAPLAYMRGRTLEDAFVILDEAQNTTIMQMKMFLTRLGFNSKMIVNGDMSQIDLPRRVKSGLVDAMEKLKGIKAIDFVHFSASDVVRHPVVADIINAYEKDAPKFDFEKKSEESDQAKEVVSGLTEYPVIGAEDVKSK